MRAAVPGADRIGEELPDAHAGLDGKEADAQEHVYGQDDFLRVHDNDSEQPAEETTSFLLFRFIGPVLLLPD